MSSFGWVTALPATRAQVAQVLHLLRATIGPGFSGLYLHGSLAMDCFNPLRSDLDLLAVVDEGMTVAMKRAVAVLLLDQSSAPHPIEISFLSRQDLTPWRFPPPFDYHYSETWRTQTTSDLETGAWQRWNATRSTDPDLAAHITILHARGVRLFGPAVAAVFPPVPRADYLTAILGDFSEARDAILTHPLYGVLNLCRVYQYVLHGRVSSKEEAGQWAASALPPEFRPLVSHALEVYRGTRQDEHFSASELLAIARYLDGRVQERWRSPSGEHEG